MTVKCLQFQILAKFKWFRILAKSPFNWLQQAQVELANGEIELLGFGYGFFIWF